VGVDFDNKLLAIGVVFAVKLVLMALYVGINHMMVYKLKTLCVLNLLEHQKKLTTCMCSESVRYVQIISKLLL
jgi:hypothetical protein